MQLITLRLNQNSVGDPRPFMLPTGIQRPEMDNDESLLCSGAILVSSLRGRSNALRATRFVQLKSGDHVTLKKPNRTWEAKPGPDSI
jgi:hypothetical protein